jgi:predicted dienelactone hydrolase
MLHDTGLSTQASGLDFTLASAHVALEVAEAVGLSAARTETMRTAITLHYSPDVTLADGPEAYLLSAAAAADVIGLGRWKLPDSVVAAVLVERPRRGFKNEFRAHWAAEAAAVSQGRAAFCAATARSTSPFGSRPTATESAHSRTTQQAHQLGPIRPEGRTMATPTQEFPTSTSAAAPSDINAAITTGRRAVVRRLAVLAAGVGLLLVVDGVADVGLLGAAVVAATLLTFGCWLFTRVPGPRALGAGAGVTLALAGVSAGVDGPTWQLVPWLVLAATVGAAAGYRAWRPRRRESRRHLWVRLVSGVGVASTVLVALVGSLALLFDPVPDLPTPTGRFAVGSETYAWTDSEREETFTADHGDFREVVAQAWYPAQPTNGPAELYEGTGVSGASLAGGYPTWFFTRFDEIDTHAVHAAPVADNPEGWPVVLFSPGGSMARQTCTALCAELASRGFVVVAMSHPYDSGATRLAVGTTVGTDFSLMSTPEQNAALVDVRVADAEFVLDQLGGLDGLAPKSVLAGHLDLGRVAMVGHSLGGAAAARMLAEDDRIDAAVNLDGRMFTAPSLDRPFLWVQNQETADATSPDANPTGLYADMAELQRDLLAGLTGPGGLVVVAGSRHLDFTDVPAYLTPLGRRLLGGLTNTGPAPVGQMTTLIADLVEGCLSPGLTDPGAISVEKLAASHDKLIPRGGITGAGPR